jgi:DNA-binding CsgD family transcriptional regulator
MSGWPDDSVRAPTRRQFEVLRSYIRAGSIAAAAHELGISETTARQHLSGLYRRTGCLNAALAAFGLGRGDLERADASPPRGIMTVPGSPRGKSDRALSPRGRSRPAVPRSAVRSR